MFNKFRQTQFDLYTKAREYWLNNPDALIAIEHYITEEIFDLLSGARGEIERDYNEASYLYPFWKNYPPEKRGRQPKGDQYPWIEVGEHTIGRKLARFLGSRFEIRDSGIPVGPDERFVLSSKQIEEYAQGQTRSVWLFADIKSVGPRDAAPHAVMSHNQISGAGTWERSGDAVKNTILKARGPKATRDFHCAVPPVYVLSDGTVAPVVSLVVKPIYRMLSLDDKQADEGQPLDRITVACIPNGLLLTCNPGYLIPFPRLFFPGKDVKTKNPLKRRARVSFDLLCQIAPWRVKHIEFS